MENQKKRKSLSLKEKLDIIQDIERGVKSQREVCMEKELPRSTVSTIWSTRHKIKSANTIQGRQDGCKRLRQPLHEEVDQALYRWCLYAREKDDVISTNILQEKAQAFAASLGVENYKCTISWLDRFRTRHGIKLRDSIATCDKEGDNRNSWFVNDLPSLLAHSYPCDVYAVTEIGLFFHVLPQENQIMGGYNNITNDQKVTLLLGMNMDGSDRLPPLVIGNSLALSNTGDSDTLLSIAYCQDPNSWMTAPIWSDWIQKFDRKMRSMKRKVVLFIDACQSHFVVSNLKAVSVHFVPVSCKHFMPLKHGIRQRFKAWYRKKVLREMVDSMNDGVVFHIDMLSALHFIRKAWEHITPDCIRNAFNLAGWIRDDGFEAETMPPLPLISQECLQLNISESIFEHVSQEEELMITREELTDRIIIESVTAQSEVQIYNDVDEIVNDVDNVQSDVISSLLAAPSELPQYTGTEGQADAEGMPPGISEARAAIETLTSFINAVEKDKNEQPPPAKIRKKKRNRKKAKVMSLCPEKGIFEIHEMKLEID